MVHETLIPRQNLIGMGVVCLRDWSQAISINKPTGNRTHVVLMVDERSTTESPHSNLQLLNRFGV